MGITVIFKKADDSSNLNVSSLPANFKITVTDSNNETKELGAPNWQNPDRADGGYTCGWNIPVSEGKYVVTESGYEVVSGCIYNSSYAKKNANLADLDIKYGKVEAVELGKDSTISVDIVNVFTAKQPVTPGGTGGSDTDYGNGSGDVTTIPDGDTPLADLPQTLELPVVDVPMAEMPEEVADIPDDEVPLAELPDEEVPLADVPETGDKSMAWLLAAIAAGLGLAGMMVTGRKRKDETAE